ncbi:hypothetical protein [Crossiella cryophila]|uniref:Uncharacterized protein n=1 Tax=Crossiella cryophila TaxID=43355 RepID=A0A7W7FV39_9PSEU|nr:hypothetical protein [Crossiella cryophila]MBB4676464.1 hypothetical protein [Crossiella cryophila]
MAELPAVLRARCQILLLRMRIENLIKSAPSELLVTGPGTNKVRLRLWGLLSSIPQQDRPRADRLIRQVHRVYGLSSDYLHSRQSSIVPSPAELAAWLACVEALELLVTSADPDRGTAGAAEQPPAG